MKTARARYLIWATMPLAVALSMPRSGSAAEPPGGPNAADIKLVEEFDANGDGWLNRKERQAALVKLRAVQKERAATRGRRGPGGPGRGGPGGPGGPGGRRGPRGGGWPEGRPGPQVALDAAPNHGDAGLYAISVLRTLFLEFEGDDWEEELAAFKPTDVEIPATLKVDGKTYPRVGLSFRGASSFFKVAAGSKRSLNLSIDFIEEDQRLHGYKSLNLLNCMGDASMMSSLLYSHIAGQKIAVPKVNFVKVVINGRSWGIYANAQQFNKDFIREHYDSSKGARWKAHGSPRGDAGLRYLGKELEPYRQRFEIKSKDKKKPWRDLVELCRLLGETAPKDVAKSLGPVLDLDGALWFLAVDVALVNSDGYWTRASDYNLFQDKRGKFHVLPHDMNEAFRDRSAGRGGGGPPRGGPPPEGPPPDGPRGPRRAGPPGRGPRASVELDPLVSIDDERFPLRKCLLANEALRTRYLQYVRLIATKYLDWDYLGAHVASARALIGAEVAADTRKLTTTEAFQQATDGDHGVLKQFCERRAAYLLGLDAIKNLPAKLVELPSRE
ncbi:MAG: CotH kinase family protein [Planctomycetota bacterium]|nr:CotH kinase family protein [Planctomycetota bacterium]